MDEVDRHHFHRPTATTSSTNLEEENSHPYTTTPKDLHLHPSTQQKLEFPATETQPGPTTATKSDGTTESILIFGQISTHSGSRHVFPGIFGHAPKRTQPQIASTQSTISSSLVPEDSQPNVDGQENKDKNSNNTAQEPPTQPSRINMDFTTTTVPSSSTCIKGFSTITLVLVLGTKLLTLR